MKGLSRGSGDAVLVGGAEVSLPITAIAKSPPRYGTIL